MIAGNPYQSPHRLPKPRRPVNARIVKLRIYRFWKRRRVALFGCAAVLICIRISGQLVPSWYSTNDILQAGLVAYLTVNVLRFLWILSRETSTRPHDWSHRYECAAAFMAVGLKVGFLYPCLCTSLTGEASAKTYIELLVVFGSPIVVAGIFALVPRCFIASIISGALVACLWILHPIYVEWIH